MDLQYFLNILGRRKWLILLIMVISSVATFYFVNQQKLIFKATGIISTGIIGPQGLNVKEENIFVQKFQVEMSFGNLIDNIQSRSNMRYLSFKLLEHDLAAFDNVNVDEPAFRKPEEDPENGIIVDSETAKEIKEILTQKLAALENTFDDADTERKYKVLAKAYGYDYETLMEDHLTIKRNGDTDNIVFEFSSEHPDLCEFAVNEFCEIYVRSHKKVQQLKDDSAVTYFQGLSDSIEFELKLKKNIQKNYKLDKNLLNLDKQSQALVSEITELELEKERIVGSLPALRSHVQSLDKYKNQVDGHNKDNKSGVGFNSRAIANMKRTIQQLNTEYIKGGQKDASLAKRRDLIKKNLEDALGKQAKLEVAIEDDELNKTDESLFEKRIDKELELKESETKLRSIDIRLVDLKRKADSYVVDENMLSNLDQDISLLEKHYVNARSKLNDEIINLGHSFYPLKLMEHAQVPEKAEPKHKVILSAFAGVVSGTLATVLIFLLAFLDISLNSPHQFKKFTNLNLIGTLNKVKTKNLDLKQLFSSNGQNKQLDSFKEALRSVRYIVENSEGNKFLFTSTKAGEGKTFMIVTLAHALTIKNKKILIVDTNFKNNTLTQMSKQGRTDNMLNSQLIGESNLEGDFMSKKINSLFNLDNVDIIGNKGTHQSPSEVFAGKNFKSFIDKLSSNYDYIFFESSAMNDYSDTKELVDFVDKVIAVFSADSEIRNADKNSIGFLKSLGNKFMGAVLNKIEMKNLN